MACKGKNFTLLSSSKYLESHTLDAHRKGLVIMLKYLILAKTEMYQYIIVKLKINFMKFCSVINKNTSLMQQHQAGVLIYHYMMHGNTKLKFF
jgi:hypothetical protein